MLPDILCEAGSPPIDVSNYTGRVDRRAPDIKLQPRELSSEIFWGHAPEEEFDMELTALDKIQLLEDNLKRYGRIDGNRPYLDIRTTPPYQPVDRPGGRLPQKPEPWPGRPAVNRRMPECCGDHLRSRAT